MNEGKTSKYKVLYVLLNQIFKMPIFIIVLPFLTRKTVELVGLKTSNRMRESLKFCFPQWQKGN